MKKKLKFFISLFLIPAIFLSLFVTPALSFKNEEITSSYAMLLINIDTDTVVFSQKSDKYWHASYMSELMTFILMSEKIEKPQNVTVTVDKEFIENLDYSDNCLRKYLGEQLTLKDLAAIMLLTSGSDAAYLIADAVSGGNVDAFVKEMNTRAESIGCKLTSFVSPGYNATKNQVTTCEDLAYLYWQIKDDELYQEIMSSPTYIPQKYGDNEAYAVTTENSIMNPASPYYFRYVTGGKYAYDRVSGASLAVTTEYKDMHYLFIALRGKNAAEENVYADARRMTTWAYLSLSDRKVIDTETSVTDASVITAWGDYDISLYADNSAKKTLPNDYDESKFEVELSVPEHLQLPLFRGETVGGAEIIYDQEMMDIVSIVPNHDEGVSMLNDLGRFGGYALAKLFPNTPELSVRDSGTDGELPTDASEMAESTDSAAARATEKQPDNLGGM